MSIMKSILGFLVFSFASSMVSASDYACFNEKHKIKLQQPLLGREAVVLVICDSLEAADYLLQAVVEDNSIKKNKAREVCREGVEVGKVEKIGAEATVPAEDEPKTFYLSVVEISDDLFGKTIFGIAAGCGAETIEHKKKRLATEEAQRKEEEQKLSDALAREAEQTKILKAQQLERELTQASNRFLDSLATSLTRAWQKPVGYRTGLECYARIQLSYSGDVITVSIVKSSGNSGFDQSLIDAINRAAPFRSVNDFPREVFEEKFQSLTIKFRPEG